MILILQFTKMTIFINKRFQREKNIIWIIYGLKKIALKYNLNTLKEILIQISYYHEGEDIYNHKDSNLIKLINDEKLIDNWDITINNKLIKQLDKIQSELLKNPELRFWQNLMNNNYIIKKKNIEMEEYLHFIMIWLNTLFYEDEFLKIRKELWSYKHETIRNWLLLLHVAKIDYEQVSSNMIDYTNILTKYEDKLFDNYNEKDLTNLFLELKKNNYSKLSKKAYLGIYLIFSWLCESRKIKEFSIFLNNLEDSKFDLMKTFLLDFIKRTKWTLLQEKDPIFTKLNKFS